MSQRVSDNAYFSAVIVLACVMLGLCFVLYLVLTDSDAGRGDKRLNPRDVPEPSRLARFHPAERAQGGSAAELGGVVTFTANVSAYCPCEKCCNEYADGITASGHVIQPGDKFVAAPKHIPFGTMLDIPGYGCVPVLDRGGAIVGNKLDIYMENHDLALIWGRQYLTVTLER